MAGRLWGLWLGGLVRDADLNMPRDDRGGLIERDKARRSPPIGIGIGFVAVLVSPLIDGMVADKRILAGAHGCRGGQSGAAGMSAVHELSHQKDGRRG
ncbi:MAG: hypothetical protein JWL84_3912 [Rhodospirillales bacterium]|nr:hypothetical protein [Rhodospirillales bacterium]